MLNLRFHSHAALNQGSVFCGLCGCAQDERARGHPSHVGVWSNHAVSPAEPSAPAPATGGVRNAAKVRIGMSPDTGPALCRRLGTRVGEDRGIGNRLDETRTQYRSRDAKDMLRLPP